MKKLLVTSFAKEALLEASCCQSVSASALDWLQTELERMVLYVAEHGVKTAGGKLQAPAAAYPVSQPAASDGGAKAKDFPERVCQRVREWRAMSDEDKARHLTEVFISWFSLNTGEKSEALHRIYITPVAEAPGVEDEEEEEPHGKKVDKVKAGRETKKGGDDMSTL